MFMHQKVTIVDDDNYRLLVVIVFAILVVSLLINSLLSTYPASVTGPPVRINGYFGPDGRPVPGYYSTTTAEFHPAARTSGKIPGAHR